MADDQVVPARTRDRAAAARQARRRYADERLAAQLRERDWLVLAPEAVVSVERVGDTVVVTHDVPAAGKEDRP